ncbi:MAG: hypothetical protein ACRC6J_04455 [Cetobacterium sp.]
MPLIFIVLSTFLFKLNINFYILLITFFEYFYGKIATERIIEIVDRDFFLKYTDNGFIRYPTEEEIYIGLKKYFWHRFRRRFIAPYNLLTTLLTYNLSIDKTMNLDLILLLIIGTLLFSVFISLGDAIGSWVKIGNFEFRRYDLENLKKSLEDIEEAINDGK